MIEKSFRVLFVFAAALLLGLCGPAVLSAETVTGAFVVKPSKIEMTIPPGGKFDRGMTLSNGTQVPLEITIRYSDILPKTEVKSGESPASLIKNGDPTQSLQKYLDFPTETFRLLSNKEVTIPISVVIPKGTTPGGRYGALVVSARPAIGKSDGNGVVNFSNEIAVLLYTRVEGDVREEGVLTGFSLFGNETYMSTPSSEQPLTFLIDYSNSGTVYLNPYGVVSIRPIVGIFGGKEHRVRVDPWAVYPGAVRSREVVFTEPLSPGVYVATLEHNKGYKDLVDTKSLRFTVLPSGLTWVWILLVLLLVGFLVRKSLRLSKHTLN